MSTEKLFILNPYNEKHLELVKQFEIKNNLDQKITESIKNITENYQKEDYLSKMTNSNRIEESLFLLESKEIVDICFIEAEKDIKTCKIRSSLENNPKNKQMLLQATNYALNTLNMEYVLLCISPADINTIKALSEKGYENLGKEGNSIVFLKDNEETVKGQRMI